MATRSLHEEYVDLLSRHGLRQDPRETSVGEKYDVINRLSGTDADPRQKGYFAPIKAAIDELERASGGGVIEEINKFGLYDGTTELYDHAAAAIRAASRETDHLPCEIYINEFPTGDFNAFARRTENGILCLLHTGLLRLLYLISIASAYMVTSSQDGFTYISQTKRPRSESREYIALCLTIQTIVDYLLTNNLAAKLISDVQIDPWGVIVASALTYSMKAFVVSHEIGHAILGHFDSSNEKRVISQHGPIEIVDQMYRHEYEADLWAQTALVASDDEGTTLFGRGGGGLAFLTIHLMIIRILGKISGHESSSEYSATHPPTMDRIRALEEHLITAYSDAGKKELLAPCAMLWRIKDLIDRSEIDVRTDSINIVPPEDMR